MPKYDFVEFRPTLNDLFEKRVKAEEEGKKEDGIERYWAFKNSESMDGLPGMRRGVETAKREQVQPIKKMVGAAALVKQPSLGLNGTSGWTESNPILVLLTGFLMGVVVAMLSMEFARGGLKGGLLVNYSEEVVALVREMRGHG